MSGEANQEAPNPFEFKTTNSDFEPKLAAKVGELREKIKVMDPERAKALIEEVQKATQEKKSANDTLDLIFGIVGKGVGLFL